MSRLSQELRWRSPARLLPGGSDVRRIVYGLRPPVLDELGLVGAVRAFLANLRSGGPEVGFEASGDLSGLPAAVEVAAYRIACEGASNVVRHRPTSC